MTAVATQHRDEVIDRIARGHTLTSIAADLQVSPQALSRVLVNDPDYRVAREVGHASRLDNAEQGIGDANDSVEVARARALWGAYSWRAERECPAVWGQRNKLDVSISLSLDVVLTEMSVVENVVTVDEAASDDVQDQ